MLLHIDKNGLNFNLQVEEKEGQGKNERGLLSDDGVGTFLWFRWNQFSYFMVSKEEGAPIEV